MKYRNSKGQLSIFLGVALFIIISLLAFVINVGLFVKAKINLQNAADAGAWAGAAVQARQLSNIAYLNWEIRNVYKEWMFKYYVLGQVSNTSKGPDAGGNNMNFRLKSFWSPTDTNYDVTGAGIDKYNVPSTCVHFGGVSAGSPTTGSQNNICGIKGLPGLPRFPNVGLVGADEQLQEYVATIGEVKADDCTNRTQLNFAVAFQWAFGAGERLFAGAPSILANRVGAWPAAFELAIRIRNVEKDVNRPLVSGAMCTGASCAAGGRDIGEVESSGGNSRINERPVKAFFSAFRNLGDELKNTFELTENGPTSGGSGRLSDLLIPSFNYDNGSSPTNKAFLDLQIMPVNYAVFYTSFISQQEAFRYGGGKVVDADSACSATKVAIPVPAYITGFAKNPEVLTYYGVQVKAKHRGLFFPFTELEGITLEANATAKPFGGRIGPRLFGTPQGFTEIKARQFQSKTSPYASGFNPVLNFTIGDPIPTGGSSFWANSVTDTIGGPPGLGGISKFVIPNLLMDFTNTAQLAQATGGRLPIISSVGNFGAAYESSVAESTGLYNVNQFNFLAGSLQGGGLQITPQEALESVQDARKPTNYEALNFMVPTADNGQNFVPDIQGTGDLLNYSIYGPLFGGNAMHGTAAQLQSEVNKYISDADSAITTYVSALEEVANAIRAFSLTPAAATTAAVAAGDGDQAVSYEQAAAGIHGDPLINGVNAGFCASLAGKFDEYFKPIENGDCGIKPIGVSMREYFAGRGGDFYNMEFKPGPPSVTSALLSAFRPGVRSGAPGGVGIPTLSGGGIGSTRRNFYSTKLIPRSNVSGGPNTYGATSDIVSETGTFGEASDDLNSYLMTNDTDALADPFF